jgi:hypothetical protein
MDPDLNFELLEGTLHDIRETIGIRSGFVERLGLGLLKRMCLLLLRLLLLLQSLLEALVGCLKRPETDRERFDRRLQRRDAVVHLFDETRQIYRSVSNAQRADRCFPR